MTEEMIKKFEEAAEEATNTNRYHININYWKSGSGYSHSETVDNVDRILLEEELLEDYGDYGWPHCEIEQRDENGERVAWVDIPGIKTRNGFSEGKDTIVVTRLGEKEFFDTLQDACEYYNINEVVETIEDFQEELERMAQINNMGPIKVKLI